MSRNIALLFALASIVTIKFILIPLIGWQDAKVIEIQRTTSLIQKSEFILNNEAVYKDVLKHLKDKNEASHALFFDNTETVQLDIQRQLETTLKKYDLFISAFNWLANESEGDFRSLLLKVEIQGELKNLARFHLSMDDEAQSQIFKLVELQIRSLRSNRDIEQFRGELVLKTFAVTKQELDVANVDSKRSEKVDSNLGGLEQ